MHICVCDKAADQEPRLLFKSEHKQGLHRLKAEAVEDKGIGREADSE